jgi:tetratricopeptide (TPR) repeat protein
MRGKYAAETLHISGYAVRTVYKLQAEQFSQALAEVTKGLTWYPNNSGLLDLSAYCLLVQKQLDEANLRYQRLMTLPDMETIEPLQRAIHLNNAGWALLAAQESEQVPPAAKRYIEQAFRMAPWVTYIRGTYGLLLVEEGRYEEGINYLLNVLQEMLNTRNPDLNLSIAEVLAECAVAFHKLGNEQEARAHLQKSMQYSPHAIMIGKAQALIGPVAA